MKLPLLFTDELQGFYKSKVMIALWIGLPVIAMLFRFLSGNITDPNMTFTLISSLVVSTVGGTLAAVMLTVSIINEKNRHVYELFLIRPLRRGEIIVAKFLAVYLCVAIASIIAVAVGIAIDYATANTLSITIISNAVESLAISLSMIAVSCAAGIFLGIVSPSILLGAILVIYGGNQISVIPLVPTILELSNANAITVAIAATVTTTFLAISIIVFNRKQF